MKVRISVCCYAMHGLVCISMVLLRVLYGWVWMIIGMIIGAFTLLALGLAGGFAMRLRSVLMQGVDCSLLRHCLSHFISVGDLDWVLVFGTDALTQQDRAWPCRPKARCLNTETFVSLFYL